jgi:hypothetical protein
VQAQIKYEEYFDTEKLPDMSNPANVRKVVYRWKQSLQEYWNQHKNWWLECNQRSLLSQDDTPDTRRSFVKNIREKTGKFYGKKVHELMKIHEELMNALQTNDECEDLLQVEGRKLQ